MDMNVLSLMVALISLIISGFTFVLWTKERNKPVKTTAPEAESTRPLQLQAYERLVLLTERIAIPNLVSRANQSGLGSAREMQILLLESIKQEFEYNASQQIYVSPVAWEAVKNLKEQNMLIINQVGAALPDTATGIDLNKALLDFTVQQQKAPLHTIVLEAINYEARKLVK